MKELAAEVVGGEDDEAAAIGDGEVHGERAGGVEARGVKGRGNGENPVAGTWAARAPDAGGGGPVAVQAEGGDGAAAGSAEGGSEGSVQGVIRSEGSVALADAIAELAVVGQSQCRRPSRHCSARRGGGAIGEGDGEGEGAAGKELAAEIVGGEDDEAAAIGDGEVHGKRAGGVEARGVKGRGDGKDPVAGTRAAGEPDAGGGGPIAVQAQGGDGTAAGGAEGGSEGSVQGAIGSEGGVALADAIAELPVVGKGERGSRACSADREAAGEGGTRSARVGDGDVERARWGGGRNDKGRGRT